MTADKLVTVASFSDEIQAGFAKAALEDEGIKAVVVGGILTGGYPLPVTMHVDVQVLNSDADRAIEILAEKTYEEDITDVDIAEEEKDQEEMGY